MAPKINCFLYQERCSGYCPLRRLAVHWNVHVAERRIEVEFFYFFSSSKTTNRREISYRTSRGLVQFYRFCASKANVGEEGAFPIRNECSHLEQNDDIWAYQLHVKSQNYPSEKFCTQFFCTHQYSSWVLFSHLKRVKNLRALFFEKKFYYYIQNLRTIFGFSHLHGILKCSRFG